ncbi:MAG: beta-ketoacyl-ACP synthase II [Chlamydiae bacterium]|nr:beta-ketoacyl-ACP synthase II [Chlamydiota bacterium]
MKKRRIVVTGMGVVSCFGTDVDLYYKKLLQGESGVGPITQFPCDEYPTRFAASVRDFEVEGYLDKKQARRVDPVIAYGMVAGKKALELAKVDTALLDKARCGILLGSGMGGMKVFSEGVETVVTKGFRRLTPFFVPFIITNMPGALLAIDLGFTGPNYSISTACATASHAIVAAAQHIERGEADFMICGGTEAPIVPVGLAGFVACKALSERNEAPHKASRPWDKGRDGFVMGEGAGVLILEELEHALARKASIFAEYRGGSISCDAHHMTDPVEDGSVVARTIEKALHEGGLKPSDVDYVNAHATSTLVGDLCEARAIKKVFGAHAPHLKINSTKSMIGHCLGAAGGMEAVATVMAIRSQEVHPTLNLEDPEEEVKGLNLVPGSSQKCLVRVAVSNSFGFGGHNASLVFSEYR